MKEERTRDYIGENFKMLKTLIVASSLAALGASMQAHADRVNLTCKAVLGGGHWNSLNGGYKFKDAGRDEFYVSFSQEPAFFQFEDRPDSSVFDRTSNLCGATYSGRTGSCQISSSKITFIQVNNRSTGFRAGATTTITIDRTTGKLIELFEATDKDTGIRERTDSHFQCSVARRAF